MKLTVLLNTKIILKSMFPFLHLKKNHTMVDVVSVLSPLRSKSYGESRMCHQMFHIVKQLLCLLFLKLMVIFFVNFKTFFELCTLSNILYL